MAPVGLRGMQLPDFRQASRHLHTVAEGCLAHLTSHMPPAGPHWRKGNRKWQQSREGFEERV